MGNKESRDFNLAAKIFLCLTLVYVTMQILGTINKMRVFNMLGYPVDGFILHIVCDAFIVVAGIFVLLKKRVGLIVFVAAFFVRLFATIPQNTNISYGYLLGQQMAPMLVQLLPFAIAMCFKKNGVSGWRSMLANSDSEGADSRIQEPKEDEVRKG